MYQVEQFSELLGVTGETGYVVETKYPIAVTNGLPGAKLNEMVMFESGDLGYVFSLDANSVQIGILGRQKIAVGTRVARTGKKAALHYSEESLGKIVDPIGEVVMGDANLNASYNELSLFVDIPPLVNRRNIKNQLITGVTVIDLLLPIGEGQRELLVGDRKTGKRQVALQACRNAVAHGLKVVYAAVGQNNADIHASYAFFKKQGIEKEVFMIGTSPFDSACMIYFAPFAGMAVAEYYAKQGHDVLLIIEDLTTHAQFYREFSLLAGRFPGRESYPGDIFYTHAHLLERAGNFVFSDGATPDKEVSITCLPMIHTPEGEISSYIATNSIGITDGHLFFDKERFLKGILPPIHVGLSVTRAGKQTQSSLLRDINRSVTTFLSEYEGTKSFSSFGSEMTPQVVEILRKGDLITSLFRQPASVTHELMSDLMLLGFIWQNMIPDMNMSTLDAIRKGIEEKVLVQGQPYADQLHACKKFDDLIKLVEGNKKALMDLCGIIMPEVKDEKDEDKKPAEATQADNKGEVKKQK